jgi:GNAT superfamily N-acetyltransferase
MINPVRWDNEKLVKQRGIVARKIDEDNLDDNIKLTHTMSPDMLYVHASQDGSDAGGARFKKIDGEWTGDIVHVYPQFRRQGIATKMYNYAEDLVGKIIPSKTLKPKGKKFWASRVDRKIDESTESTNHVLFLGPNAVIVGQEHGKPLKLSDEEQQKIKDIADKYGAWYEGNGMDQKHTKGIIDDYKGSWDDDLLSPSIKGYPSPFLYVLFSNIKENDTVDGKIGFDPKSTIFDRILDTQPSTNYFPNRKFDAETLQKFLKSVSENQYDFVKMSQAPATEKNVRKFFTQGEKLMFPDNWEEYPYRAGRVAKSVNDLRDKFLATRKKGVYVAGSDHLKAVTKFKDKK